MWTSGCGGGGGGAAGFRGCERIFLAEEGCGESADWGLELGSGSRARLWTARARFRLGWANGGGL